MIHSQSGPRSRTVRRRLGRSGLVQVGGDRIVRVHGLLVGVSFEPNKAILHIVLPYWYEHIEIDGTNFTVHYGLLLVCHQNYIRTYDHSSILVLWIRFK